MRFATHRALADLPYFELRHGRLVALDPDWGPVIDAHTHLALSYIRDSVDLEGEGPPAEHYLPVARPLDLDVYMNRNFEPADLARMKRDLTLRTLTGGGLRATHTVANLTREMRELAISTSVLLPIDLPVMSHNADRYLELASRHPELVSLGSVHPLAKVPASTLTAQRDAGARGIKLHPAVQMIAADHPRAMELYAACAELRLPVFFHCGPVGIETARGRALSQLGRYRAPIERYPDCTFVLGHSGALQMEQALELACRHDNVYLELACQSLSNVRELIRRGPTDRILFGTDWPFYHQAPGLAKVLLATEGEPAIRRRILRQNAAALFGIAA